MTGEIETCILMGFASYLFSSNVNSDLMTYFNGVEICSVVQSTNLVVFFFFAISL